MLIPFIWGKKSVTVDMAVSNFHSALFLTVNDLWGDQIRIFSEISLSSPASRWHHRQTASCPQGSAGAQVCHAVDHSSVRDSWGISIQAVSSSFWWDQQWSHVHSSAAPWCLWRNPSALKAGRAKCVGYLTSHLFGLLAHEQCELKVHYSSPFS